MYSSACKQILMCWYSFRFHFSETERKVGVVYVVFGNEGSQGWKESYTRVLLEKKILFGRRSLNYLFDGVFDCRSFNKVFDCRSFNKVFD